MSQIALTPSLPVPVRALRPLRAVGATAIALAGVGAIALGTAAVGALAVGAVAVGRMALGELRLRRARAGQAEVRVMMIEELTVGHLVLRNVDRGGAPEAGA